MSSEKWKKLNKKMAGAAAEKKASLRGVKIASVIAEALRQINVDAILVGGSAVAFYTEGKYTTQDIDMIAPSGKDTEHIMKQIGFSRHGKDYIHDDLDIYVEFPSDQLEPTEQINIINVGNIKLKIISIEDMIVDRLCAFKYWKSEIDGVNALIMIELGIGDQRRIEDRAREEDVLDALDYLEHAREITIRKKLTPKKSSELLRKYFRRSV